MAMFRYEAVDSAGKSYRGVMQAADQADLTAKLQARGFRLVRVAGGSQQAAAPVSAPRAHLGRLTPAGLQAVAYRGMPVSVKSVVPASALAAYLRQLATMVTAGMPLYQSLRENLTYIRNNNLKRASIGIAEKIEHGGRLSDAMAQYTAVFPAHVIGCVVSGELGGDMDIYLQEAAADYEKEAKDTFIGRIGWALTKANIMQLTIGLPIVIVMPSVVGELMGVAGSARPDTQAILQPFLRQILNSALPVALVATVAYIALIYGWEAIKKSPEVRFTLDQWRAKFPPWSTIHRNRSVVRFMNSMERLINAGVEPGDAWEASCLMCRDNGVGAKLRQGFAQPGSVFSLTERIASANVLQMEEIGIISSGERTGKIGESLGHVAAVYEQKEPSLVIIGRGLAASGFFMLSAAVVGALSIPLAGAVRGIYDYFLNM